MIKQGDCLELLKEIPDGSVDMILDDLPYGTTDCAFDKRIPFEPMWEEFLRVTKHNAAIVLFSQMPFGSDLIQSQRKFFRYEWIWEKSLGVGFLNANRMPCAVTKTFWSSIASSRRIIRNSPKASREQITAMILQQYLRRIIASGNG